jgi:hypothetical protein
MASRVGFWVSYKAQDPEEGTKPGDAPVTAAKENMFSSFSCELHVANFLDITALAGQVVKRTVKGYEKTISKLGVTPVVNKTFTAKEVDRMCSVKPKAKTVMLTTGAKTAKGTNRTLSLTFPSAMTIPQIAETLAETIPATKIQRGSTSAPSVTEIYPKFKVKGGGTYAIPTKEAAETSTNVDVPDTVAAQQTTASKPK